VKRYLEIAAHYEACLERHGDSHLGVDWPNAQDAETRYRVMLDVIRPQEAGPVSLLDFGCGASHTSGGPESRPGSLTAAWTFRPASSSFRKRNFPASRITGPTCWRARRTCRSSITWS
jgi:hypothetical protein